MRARLGAVVGVLVLSGCATTHVLQRGGCWVRQTETFPKTVREDLGPCLRGEPRWSEDRVARLVQECMAEADFRWQNEAVAAWNKGLALPAQQSEQTVMRACMGDASTAVVTENEALRRRLAEVLAERESMRKTAELSLARLQESQDRMTDALGEAAKKPAPSALATATSTGTAATQAQPPAEPTSVTVNATSLPMPVPVAVPPPVRAPEQPRLRVCANGAKSSCVPPTGATTADTAGGFHPWGSQ